MDRAEAIERARKLMALGESDNEHESAAAIAQAQAILERYEIATADLATHAEAEPMLEGSWTAGTRTRAVTWKQTLANRLARANGCTLFSTGPKVTVCGRTSDVRRTAKTYGWIASEVERIARANCRGQGVAFANAFKLGAVRTIASEIEAESRRLRDEMRGTVSETALTIIDTRRRDSDKWMRGRHLLQNRSQRSSYSSSAGYAAGSQAGSGVYGRSSQGALRGGQRLLKP